MTPGLARQVEMAFSLAVRRRARPCLDDSVPQGAFRHRVWIGHFGHLRDHLVELGGIELAEGDRPEGLGSGEAEGCNHAFAGAVSQAPQLFQLFQGNPVAEDGLEGVVQRLAGLAGKVGADIAVDHGGGIGGDAVEGEVESLRDNEGGAGEKGG
ncbi:MAG: hypothetical protein ACOX5G_00755 [Kiritimatiellia bacterium]